MQNTSITCLSLSEIKTGEHVFYLGIQAGRGIASRLTSLGFTPGVQIDMTQNYGHGPLVVTIRGTRVALGREEAKKILVEKEASA